MSGLVVSALTQQAVAQGYKVVGSMELLGDPLSLVGKVRFVRGSPPPCNRVTHKITPSPPPLRWIPEPFGFRKKENTEGNGGLLVDVIP